MGFKERLKEARISKKFKQTELSEKIGLSPNVVSNYENGTSKPNIDVLYKLLDILEVEPNFLFQDDIKFENMSLSLSEKLMIDDFRTLTASGQKKAADYIKDLSLNPYYSNSESKSAPKNGLEEKNTVRIAARNGEYKEIELTKEEEKALADKNRRKPKAKNL